jgi:hypothetical protein
MSTRTSARHLAALAFGQQARDTAHRGPDNHRSATSNRLIASATTTTTSPTNASKV